MYMFELRRRQLGLSQFEFCKRLDIGQSKVCEIEKGRRIPDEDFKNRVAHVLNDSVSRLFRKVKI